MTLSNLNYTLLGNPLSVPRLCVAVPKTSVCYLFRVHLAHDTFQLGGSI